MSIPSINTGNTKLDHMLAEWFRLDKNEKTIAETKALLEKNDIRELESRFLVRMEFGTAGLRARMAAGYACMNDLTIIQSGQGLLKYLESTVPNLRTAGFVVGYDARHNSRRFAELTASIFLHADVPVYMFRQISPTPFVPYAVLRYKCACGVMVTASHNPKEDNGYKVYWGNGSQIISPHDKGISQNIDKHLDPFPTSWDTSPVSDNSPLLKEPFDDVMDAYFKDMDATLCTDKEACARTSIKFTYTAMHGVGYEFSLKSAHTFGLSTMIPVVEQVQPDPDFPTVKFPNPEEGKSALELAIKTANANESTVILANDPDADRLAVAEKKPDGAWKVFTGNELGALFGWYSWYAYRKTHPDVNADNVYMLASTVSSKIIAAIARKEGFHFEETLTGFKWMGNRSDELLRAGKTVLFAFEEAIGFMCGVKVLDKDGVSALGVIIEMASILKEQGFTLQQKLEDIYTTYGLHISRNSYFLCYDPHVIQTLFDRLRNYGGANQYPTQCGPFQIKSIRDLTTGFDNSRPDNKAVLPSSKSSQMITFSFTNGCIATMRTSGTEPKIKYYTELCGEPGKGREELQNELNQLVANIVEHFYEPEKNGITPQAD